MHIDLRGILKRYGAVRALDHVSLQIEPGELVSVVGLNGAGKSTLLRTLAGLTVPDEGNVYYDDEEFHRGRLELRRRLMFLGDFPVLFFGRSILWNLATVTGVYGVDRPGLEGEAVEWLKKFDLLALANNPLHTLSRGQFYKAALVGMFLVDPELWLLDEPFASGMDPHGIQTFKETARKAVEHGRTVIYTTQLLDLAERFSDRVCVIDQGEIRAFETLDSLKARARDPHNVLEGLFRQLKEENP